MQFEMDFAASEKAEQSLDAVRGVLEGCHRLRIRGQCLVEPLCRGDEFGQLQEPEELLPGEPFIRLQRDQQEIDGIGFEQAGEHEVVGNVRGVSRASVAVI